MIKNNEPKEKTEESKDSFDSSQKEEERPKSPTPPPARKSPEPSCAICLEHLTNKSFTDSCFHMFCFTCLVEWSKVKPECPLCKKGFSSIVHNVRSFKDYDQYYVNKSRLAEDRSCVRRFHYRTTLTPDRLHVDSNRLEYLSHRMRFAPHSVHSFRISYASSLTARRAIPNSFRQRVYDENLWVFPLNSNRIRCISPAFYRQNVACTHRLLPWLNRELLVVMPNNESQIAFVIELIMALIVKYEIRSQEFHTLIEPYTADHTAHFIHEFYNFAVSPYETIETYDIHAQYEYGILPTMSYETVSSPDSDVIPLPMDFSSSMQQGTSNDNDSTRRRRQSRKKHARGCKKLKKIILKRNSEKNVWESVSNSNYIPGSVSFELAGPSTSQAIPFITDSPESPNIEVDVVNDDDDDNDECQVVDVLKPKRERTPEIVTLLTDDEATNIASEDEAQPTIISVVGADDQQSLTLSDDECEILYFTDTKTSQNPSRNNDHDKPIDYSLKTIEKQFEAEPSSTPTIEQPGSSGSGDKYEKEIGQLHKQISDTIQHCMVKPERSSVIQSVVHAVTTEDTASSSLSPLLKPRKRPSFILDDASTESCSDSAQVSEVDTGKKKLKLKSVVAHYAFEQSDEHDSTHHSSSMQKKHRERKKKKKKHKHRRRVLSSDSD